MYHELTEEDRNKGYKRDIYLDKLLKNLEDHKQNKAKNIAILGQHYIGKSYLLKTFIQHTMEYPNKKISKGTNMLHNANNANSTTGINSSVANELVCLVDFSKIAMTPESFCISVILSLTSWHLKRDIISLDECKLGEKTSESVDKAKNELLKIKPSHALLAEIALSFPECLATDLNKKVVICIDEIWRVLDLNNYAGIENIIKIFKKIISSHKNAMYITTSSAVHLMKRLNNELQFEVIELTSLRLNDVGNDELHYYSNGIPQYAGAIKQRIGNTNAERQPKYNTRESFLIEALWKSGAIYQSCMTILNDTLYRARGRGLLLDILKALCDNNGLRLSEVSRKIYRSAAVTKNLITRLIEVDIIIKEENRFTFNDPILKFWFRHYITSSEFDHIPDKEMLKKIKVDL